ncbi:MAG: hypothetical protein WCJ09_12405 [Planctomycetota bacterium]
MSQLLIVVVCLLGQWLLGLAVTRLVFRWTDSKTSHAFCEQLGLGIVLGIGLNAWGLFLWSWLGGTLGPSTSIVLAGLGIIAGIPLLLLKSRIINGINGVSERLSSPDQGRNAEGAAFCIACQWGIGLLTVVALVQSLMTPLRLWDERAHFSIKASVMFEDRSIRSADLAERDFVQGHPRYPLLIPLAQVHLYFLLGEINDRLAKVYFPLLFAGLVLTTVGVLMRHLTTARAWLWGMILATVPALMPNEYGFLCGQADAPVACFHGIAILYAWDVLERLRRDGVLSISSLIIAGLSSGLTVFTKDEGIAYLIIDMVALALMLTVQSLSGHVRRNHGIEKNGRVSESVGTILVAGIVVSTCAAVIVVPWLMHRRDLPQTAEMAYADRLSVEYLFKRFQTLTWSAPHLGQRMFWEWYEWGLQWWFMAVAMMFAPRRLMRPAQMLLLIDVLGALAALLVAGMLAPVQLEEHIGGSSHRFLMQITPVAILFAASQLGSADRSHVETSEADSP